MTKHLDPAPLEPASQELPAPRILSRAEHPISRKNIDREALKVLYRLRDAGFTAYLVGGGVRDLYLGKAPKDFDISTDAKPGQLLKLFRNSRIIGRRFRLVQVFFPGNKIIEVSTFRCRSEFEELEGDEQVLASNNTFGSPVEDAFRRDLTINALFYEIENFTVIDYVNGVEDLDNGIVRLIGDPDRRIIRDPVRMMRIIRHAARSNFTIEKKTLAAIKTHKEELRLCPVSRIRDELLKDLQGGASRRWAELAVESGLFRVIFPFYRQLDATAWPACADEIHRLLAVSDRLHREGQKLPEHLLFSMLVLPWAKARLKLMELRRGPDFGPFVQNLRRDVDELLLHLNLKRAIREEITILLSNLPLFAGYQETNNWPKAVKRKSYYPSCLLFYRINDEASGGKAVPTAALPKATEAAEQPADQQRRGRRRPRKRSGKSRKGGAAYTDTKGGIFGFKP